MLAGIRTRDLRKVYTSAPPLAAGGGFSSRRKNKQPAREIVALDGLSLDIRAGLMFSLVLTPMIFFGCTYYPWSALANFPILQKVVLINPLVYASEGFRGTLVPQFPHLPVVAVFLELLIFDSLLLFIGLRQFHRKAVT